MKLSNGQQPHILAINHSPDVLQLLKELLVDEGYKVTLRSHLDRDLPDINHIAPDLIMIDYMWTTSDENWSLFQLLRLNPQTRETPIVLCTGAIKEAISLNEHLSEMSVDVVLKPFDIDRLMNVIAAALERHSAVEESRD